MLPAPLCLEAVGDVSGDLALKTLPLPEGIAKADYTQMIKRGQGGGGGCALNHRTCRMPGIF